VQYPQININGATAMDLAQQYDTAARAVEHAAELVGRLVHGRDYQTLSPDLYQNAVRENTERVKTLIAVYNDLMEIAHYCAGEVR